MDDIVRFARDEVLRSGYHKPVIAFTGIKFDGSTSRGMFIVEASASSHKEKATLMYMSGAKLGSDKFLSRMNRVFLVAEDWVKVGEPTDQSKKSEMIVGLHVSCLDLETNKQMYRTFEYIKDERGNVKELKPVKTDTETNNPLLPAFIAGFNTTIRQ